jgi:fructose-1,6-bisphosphatase/inositol monophosphatase family enzyme
MNPPWSTRLPEDFPGPRLAGFLTRFTAIADRWPAHQPAMMRTPVLLPRLERAIEAEQVALIRSWFSEVPILTEEYFTATGEIVEGRGRLSVVLDPLDGSASYLRGSPRYAVSLAFLLDGVTTVAFVYPPATGLMRSAYAGHGAWVGAQPLRRRPEYHRRIVAVKVQHLDKEPVRRRAERLTARGYRLERMESTSLKLCWVAEGRRAGIVKWLSERAGVTQEWGTTAGALICREVGIEGRTFDDEVWHRQSGGLVIADARCGADLGYTIPGEGRPTRHGRQSTDADA